MPAFLPEQFHAVSAGEFADKLDSGPWLFKVDFTGCIFGARYAAMSRNPPG